MSDDERRKFEGRLANEADLKTELYVREGLSQLRLQKKVEAAAAARKAMKQSRFWRRFIGGLALAGVFALALFVVFKEADLPKTSDSAPAKQAPGQPIQPDMNRLQPAEQAPALPKFPEQKQKKPTQQPIAGVDQNELPPPAFPGPNIRGENSDNKAWKTLLDQVWYTDYPPAALILADTFAEADQLLKSRDFNKAYVRLQRLERKLPDNDTLRYLKGYCLMEMGEGAEALTYFENIEAPLPALEGQLQWYRGLCSLLAGEQQKALAEFKKIAATPKHPYRRQSQRAVALLNG